MFALGAWRLLLEDMVSDGELLRQYIQGSQPAFKTLVERHLGLVYGAALRRVGGDGHSAEDVAQRVFTDLARKAPTLRHHPNLSGWLYTSARFAAAAVVRAETRRRAREEAASAMDDDKRLRLDATSTFEPVLDDVIEQLSKAEREVVLLHFFEDRPYPEIADLTGLSADAARMRVNRALEKMRAILQTRGVTCAGALGAVLAKGAVSPPAGTVERVAEAAANYVAGSAAGTGLYAAIKVFVMAKPLLTVGILMWAGGLVGGIWYVGSSSAAAESIAAESGTIVMEEVNDSPAAATAGAVQGEPSANAIARGQADPPFEALTPTEKNVLAMLWEMHESRRAQPKGRWGMRIGTGAPNHPAVAPLVAKGLIEFGPKGNAVFLSADGIQFCLRHRTELAAVEPTGNFMPPRPRG